MFINARLLIAFSLLLQVTSIYSHVGYCQDYTSIRGANEPSVVFIHSKRTRKDGTGIPENNYGTGFLISKDGHVLTASHVVLKDDDQTIVDTSGSIRSRHGQRYKLEPIKRDEDLDIALLMFPDVGIDWKPVTFGNSRSVPKDAHLYALGFPGNFELSPATGILSNKFGPKGTWQTTLPINRGHSGGPVFDIAGKVVAIASAGSDEFQQITFVIPESYAIGLRQLALNIGWNMFDFASQSPSTPRTETISRKFVFYQAVDHEGQMSEKEFFCLPRGYEVTSIKPKVTTQNGPGTKLTGVSIDPVKTNCVAVSAFIKGAGVARIGPIIVDHKGRGWLGAELDVNGQRIK